MTDNIKDHRDKVRGGRKSPHVGPERDDDSADESCAAFGYLRGIREKADSLEMRFRNGNSAWLPYHWLGNWKYNPSNGLMLKFSGDVVYLVLVSGSNLDRPLLDSTTNLTRSGLQRRRIAWMREMTEEEIRKIGESGPTIDSIQVLEFESNADLLKWLELHAPSFLPNH